MTHVFISYSRRDGVPAGRMIGTLRQAGYSVWIDKRGIAAGDQWRRDIVEAIGGAGLFLLVLSPNAARSDNVRKELDLAEGRKLRLLPVAIAPVDIPDHMQYQLAGLQILQLWRERDGDSRALLAAVRRYGLARRAPSGSTPAPAEPPGRDSELDLSHLGGGGVIASWLGKQR